LPLPVRALHWLWTGTRLPKYVEHTTKEAARMVRTTPATKAKKKFNPDTVEPIVITKNTEEIEQILLFSMVEDDGEKRDFFIPKKVKFSLTLQLADKQASEGETAAGVWLLKKLLGEDGFQAIAYSDDVTQEQFDQILEIAMNIAMGPTEGKAR
jgi:hypothetical protein